MDEHCHVPNTVGRNSGSVTTITGTSCQTLTQLVVDEQYRGRVQSLVDDRHGCLRWERPCRLDGWSVGLSTFI